jgi:hypothetical protein
MAVLVLFWLAAPTVHAGKSADFLISPWRLQALQALQVEKRRGRPLKRSQ